MKNQILNEEVFMISEALSGDGLFRGGGALHRIDVQARRTSIKKIVTDLQSALIASNEYMQYTKEVDALIRENEDKNAPVVPGHPRPMKNHEQHVHEIKLLKQKYADVIEETERVIEEYNNVTMYLPAKVKVPVVYLSDFAKDQTLFYELYGMAPIIDWDKKGAMLGKKTAMTFVVKEILGDTLESGDSIITKVALVMKRFPFWDISRKIAYNTYMLRLQGYRLLKDKGYSNYLNGYEKDRIELCRENSYIEANGEVARNQDGSFMIRDMPAFQEGLAILKEKHKKIIGPYIELMKTEIEVPCYAITKTDIKELDKFVSNRPDAEVLLNNEVVEIISRFSNV